MKYKIDSNIILQIIPGCFNNSAAIACKDRAIFDELLAIAQANGINLAMLNAQSVYIFEYDPRRWAIIHGDEYAILSFKECQANFDTYTSDHDDWKQLPAFGGLNAQPLKS